MKRLSWCALLALVAVCVCATTASAVHRTVLLETFTNTSCGPCAICNPFVEQFMAKYSPALAIGVQYHTWWPSATDPFYLLTQAEGRARAHYYGVHGVPTNATDGGWVVAGYYEAELDTLEADAAPHLMQESPFALTVADTVAGGQVNVTVTVDAVDAPPAGNLRLRVVLIETEVHYATPPGNNGEKDFYDTMRRMLPDSSGTTLILAQGQQHTFNFSTPVVAQWNTANIRAVAWIQNDDTKEILQAGGSFPQPAYASYFGTLDLSDLVHLGKKRTFRAVLTNRGTNADTYNIHVTRNVPAGWATRVRGGGVWYQPWTTDFAVMLNPGAVDSVLLEVTPIGSAGTGTVTLTATSVGSPSTSWSRTFQVVSSGFSALLMDCDYGNDFETWYSMALDSARCSHAIWDRFANGPLTAAQLEDFAVVLWNVDLISPPLDSLDMAALGTYLDHGGRLLISGQDVGWSLCDSTSPDCTPQSRAWYAQYLGARYVANVLADSSNVHGVTGDPIGDGLSFSISGGTGGSWQWNPDVIDPLAGASPILYYHPGQYAGIRYQNGAYKVVYLAYGFQAQATYASQRTLMLRSLQWLLDCAGPGDVADGAPIAALAPRAAPNPFGSATRISFVVPGKGAVPVSVLVYDIAGRRVRTLWEGPATPGARSLVWDGRDDAGARAPSGIYLARVRVGTERRTLKLVLTE